MEPSLQELLELYADKLSQTFSAASQQQQRQAEEELAIFQNNDRQFFENMLSLMKHPNFSRKLSRSCREDRSANNLGNVAVYLYQVITDGNLSESLKENFKSTLERVLIQDKDDTIKKQLMLKVRENFQNFNSLNEVASTLLLYDTLQKSCTSETLQTAFTQILVESFVEIGKYLVINSAQVLAKQSFESCQEILNVLMKWCKILHKFLSKLCKIKIDVRTSQVTKKQCLFTIISSAELAAIVRNVLLLQAAFASDINSAIAYINQPPQVNVLEGQAFQEQQQINAQLQEADKVLQLLNSVKAKALKAFNEINKFSFRKKNNFDLNASVFYQMQHEIAFILYDALLNFTVQQEELSGLFQNTETQRQVIKWILLPTLLLSQEEYSQFEKRANDYVESQRFIFEDCKNKTYKSACAAFLRSLSAKIAGFDTLLHLTALSLVIWIAFAQQQGLDNLQKNLGMDCTFFTSTDISDALRLDCALHLILLDSETFEIRDDLRTQAQEVLFALFEKIRDDDIFTARIAQIFGASYNCLAENTDKAALMLYFLVGLVDTASFKKPGRAVAFTALRSLERIYSDQDYITNVQDVLKQNYKVLTDKIPKIKILAYFDLLEAIVNNYGEIIHQMPALLKKVIKRLVVRILTEVRSLEQGTQKSSQTIYKCWHIIQCLLQHESFKGTAENLQKIEQALFPVINLVATPHKIEFSEEIVAVMALLIEKQSSVSVEMLALVEALPQMCQIRNQGLLCVLPVLNKMIIFGKEHIQTTHLNLIRIILQLAESAIKTVSEEQEAEIDQARGALLFQCVLENLSDTCVQPSELQAILNLAINTLKEKQIKNDFLFVRVAGIIMMSLLTNFQLTQPVLADAFASEALWKSVQKARQLYDIKLCVIALSTCLKHGQSLLQHSPASVLSLIIDKLEQLSQWYSLSEEQKLKKKKKKAADKKKKQSEQDTRQETIDDQSYELKRKATTPEDVIEQEEQEEENKQQDHVLLDENHLEEQQSAIQDEDFDNYYTQKDKRTLIEYQSKITEMDVYQYFKDTISALGNGAAELLTQQLPPKQQAKLRLILQTVAISSSQVRRVVKVKRNN